MPRILVPIPVDEEKPKKRRIAWWIENTLIRAVKRSFNSISEQLRELVNFSLLDVIENLEGELIGIVEPWAQIILETPNVPENLKLPIRKALNQESPAAITILISLAGGMLGGVISGVIGPFAELFAAETHNVLRARWFDPDTATAMYVRDIINDDEYKRILHHNGLDDTSIEHIRNLGKPLLSQSELARLMWRGILNEEGVKRELGRHGYDERERNGLVELMEIRPSPNELISMAVREAFSDEIAAQFSYDEDYPAHAGVLAEKAGYKEQFFRYAWRAHWKLPGLVQVREMYHRGIIADDELYTYLKAADLPVFWRDKITEWMSQEVTRVDIRRIFSLGLITPQEMYERYLRLGYRPDDAALMTQWTAAAYLEDDRDLTKSDILSMYRDGILNDVEANEYLTALDYRPEAISLYLAHQDLKRQEQYESRIIRNVEDLYKAGIYDRTDVFDQLGKLDTPATFIEQSLNVWDIEKDKKDSVPTTAQLRNFAQEGIITWERFRVEMYHRGYKQEYINWYEALYRKEDEDEV